MKVETREQRRDLSWGLPASLILHVLIIALLIYGLPRTRQQPQEEQAVKVALVPMPDQPKSKPKPVPKDPAAEKPPQPEVQPPKPAPIEVLKPVFQFGDKDAGPRKSLDGGGSQDNPQPAARNDDTKPPVAPEDAENKPASAGSDEQAVSTPAPAGRETEAQDNGRQAATPPTTLTTAGSNHEIELPASAEAPQPRPARAARASNSEKAGAKKPSSMDIANAISRGYSGLPGVRKLYSQGATGDVLATNSMAGISRDQRVAKLCASELQQQLLGASYFPDLVPLVPLRAGNVLDVPKAAFHTRTTWYDLSFRCEVDPEATRVLSFNFRVGTAIPPDQWARLGLPAD